MKNIENYDIFSSTSNQFDHILRLFNVLSNFPFTTSKTMGNYQLKAWYIRVAERVAERIKTQDLRKLADLIRNKIANETTNFSKDSQ